jgi:hypothetical protein
MKVNGKSNKIKLLPKGGFVLYKQQKKQWGGNNRQ